MHPLVVSLQIATAATVLTTIVAIALAAALARRRSWLRSLAEVLFRAPLFMPPTVVGYFLLVTIGAETFIGRTFESVFGVRLVFSLPAAVLAAAVTSFPLVFQATLTAFDAVPQPVLDVARTLVASRRSIFLRVTLPLSRHGIAGGVALGFAKCLGEFGATLIVAGNIPGRTQTAAIAMYDALEGGRYGDVNMLALSLAGLALLFAALGWFFESRAHAT